MKRRNQVGSRQPSTVSRQHAERSGFTLVEMLIAMAITLVMVGAVVALFANVSNSVRNRRAVVEVSGQLRHVRNMLQQDLRGATCPGLPWRRPEDNQGYIEIVEGPYSDRNPSSMIRDTSNPPDGVFDEADFDVALSFLPRNDAGADTNSDGKIDPNELRQHTNDPRSLVPGGLGDADDVLMLTVRNEHEPFVGRVPEMSKKGATSVRPNQTDAAPFGNWNSETIESPLAEVVWYAVENPRESENANGYFGEPGMRTIYRRTLLVAPWVNPYRFIDATGSAHDGFSSQGGGNVTFQADPGLVRVLPASVDQTETEQALAALVAFQERYDLSVRLEWDRSVERWKIVANTLADLTKRENRYEHHFYRPASQQREYPFALVSAGGEYDGVAVAFRMDGEIPPYSISPAARATAVLANANGISNLVARYTINPGNLDATTGPRYPVRPYAYVDDDSNQLATARAMLNDEGQVVRVIHGLVPLSQERRGEDVMLTDVLAFDLRVYDPGAPLYGVLESSNAESAYSAILEPADPGWKYAYRADVPSNGEALGDLATFVGQGAFVDLGYAFGLSSYTVNLPTIISPWFAEARALSDVYAKQLAPGYAGYDTWSLHYENNGLNDDHDFDANGKPMIDEGTNGLDDWGHYQNPSPPPLVVTDQRLGVDDVGERETAPPYDKPLRGMQVVLRLYERDSRQVRQVSVVQHFVPE